MITSKAFTPITITLETHAEVVAMRDLCTYHLDHKLRRYTLFREDKLHTFVSDLLRRLK